MNKNPLKYFVLLLLLAVAMPGCDKDLISTDAGRLPDEAGMGMLSSTLRSDLSFTGITQINLTVEDAPTGILADRLCYKLSQPAAKEVKVTVTLEPGMSQEFLDQIKAENEVIGKWNPDHTEKKLMLRPTPFPAEHLRIEGDGILTVPAGKTESAAIGLKMLTQGLTVQLPTESLDAPGDYLVYELRLAVEKGEGEEKVRQILRYRVDVRQKAEEWEIPAPWNPSQTIKIPLDAEFFSVFYLNTETYQPLLAGIFRYEKTSRVTGQSEGQYLLGNIVNLKPATVGYEPASGRALFSLGNDLRYVLEHAGKYIRPLQERGQKVCLCIQGGGKGLGFCNMSDAQIADFTRQVKEVVELYRLDGINLWDEGSAYGKEGMPPVNTTSYPKLIERLRDVLPEGKLLTLVDKGEPTASFYDAGLCGGIEVGKCIDYAWHGYSDVVKRNEMTLMQIIDPWAADHPYCDPDFIRKPIAGLTPERYGSINIPRYEPAMDQGGEGSYSDMIGYTSPKRIVDWRVAGRKKNNIVVFGCDLIARMPGSFESGSIDELSSLGFVSDEGHTRLIIRPNGSKRWQGATASYIFGSIMKEYDGGGQFYSKDW